MTVLLILIQLLTFYQHFPRTYSYGIVSAVYFPALTTAVYCLRHLVPLAALLLRLMETQVLQWEASRETPLSY